MNVWLGSSETSPDRNHLSRSSILTIGARLTLSAEVSDHAFKHSQIELGVNVAVVLGLAIGLLLVRMREPAHPASEYQSARAWRRFGAAISVLLLRYPVSSCFASLGKA